MGQILASLEVKSGYGAYMIDFHISKNTSHSPDEKIRLFVAQRDNVETSACIISPQQVNFLLNGKGVEKRNNVSLDPGPQMPTNVTAMLKYGTNLLQAVGQFNGNYIIAVGFMSEVPLPGTSVLPDYVQSDAAVADPDSDIIEGPSRVSLNCPISYSRIRTPIKGHSCKHLQCFDFSNFIEINSRRPSWRCPHCNQHVCYSDIRVDQNMVKVLKEVGENVVNVIISVDGSWKAVMESDENMDHSCKEPVNCQKETPEQQEPATSLIPSVLDLTEDDDRMDAMSTSDVEDRKPFQSSFQSQSVATNLTMPSHDTNVFDQNASDQLMDELLSGYLNDGSGASIAGLCTQTVNGIPESSPGNAMTSSVSSDAISPVLNCNFGGHGNNSLTSLTQTQFSASGDLHQLVNAAVNNEYGRFTNIPRHVNRTSIAVQALAVASQISAQQQRSRTNLNGENPNGAPQTSQPTLPAANGFNTASISHTNAHQGLNRVASPIPHYPTGQNRQDRPYVSGQSFQQVNPLQLLRAPRFRNESQNLHQLQALQMPQSRSQSPTVVRLSSPLPRVQTPQGAAQVGAGIQQTRFGGVAPRPVQMPRQPPSVPVLMQTSRVNLNSNTDRTWAPPAVQRGNVGAAGQVNTGADGVEQNWQPTGRMRGRLSGQAAAAYRDLIIQPTQTTQAPQPPVTSTQRTQAPQPPVISTPPSISSQLQHNLSPQLQAFLANGRNFYVPQNNPATQPASMNGSSGSLP
ncbi:hypothetical protein JCGZ_20531 [Jatropha curcas]|uniref:SP-RING-type domain-containing protein n=2 Tax=Jatropha curcas TaxID=180498 RepID=A0A067JZD9_JATCU|nr:hypothetical protein JCGZ_20531 [Jatropha curcas]